MGSISKEYSKYNKSEANNFISSVDVLIEKLDTLGYSNSNLMGFIDHINSSNQSNYNSNAAIWHGNSARAFAGKVETYLKNVKKLRILANDYRNAAIDMVEYEETIDEWEGNSPGLLGALETIGASGATGGAIGSALPGIGTVIGAAGGVISGIPHALPVLPQPRYVADGHGAGDDRGGDPKPLPQESGLLQKGRHHRHGRRAHAAIGFSDGAV